MRFASSGVSSSIGIASSASVVSVIMQESRTAAGNANFAYIDRQKIADNVSITQPTCLKDGPRHVCRNAEPPTTLRWMDGRCS